MKIKLLAVLSCLTLCVVSLGQTRQSLDEDIIHFVETYDGAWNHKDAAKIEPILAPDYVYFTSKGGVMSRQHMLDMMLSAKYLLASAERSEIQVYRTSNTAVVSSRWKGHGTYNGQAFRDDERCSIVLGLEKQPWQVLAEHCTEIVVP